MVDDGGVVVVLERGGRSSGLGCRRPDGERTRQDHAPKLKYQFPQSRAARPLPRYWSPIGPNVKYPLVRPDWAGATSSTRPTKKSTFLSISANQCPRTDENAPARACDRGTTAARLYEKGETSERQRGFNPSQARRAARRRRGGGVASPQPGSSRGARPGSPASPGRSPLWCS